MNEDKFKNPKTNKASHFNATLRWQDGQAFKKRLSDRVESKALESVGYIPQNHLETICNDIQTANNSFDRELKSVIFSHVDEAHKLKANTIDELLDFLTQQTRDRLDALRAELSAVNKSIADLEKQRSKESKQYLLNLLDEKRRELDAHDKAKPAEVPKPAADENTQVSLGKIASSIQEHGAKRTQLESETKQLDLDVASAVLRQARANSFLQRVENFTTLYEAFVTAATPDCIELKLRARDVVKIELNLRGPKDVLESAKSDEAAAQSRSDLALEESAAAKAEIARLTQLLDAPNIAYQTYIQTLDRWKKQRAQIEGDGTQPGTLNYVQVQVTALADIPARIANRKLARESKVVEIYKQLQREVADYKSLYAPVQQFIRAHKLAGSKFTFEFEASISCTGLEDDFLSKINQGRRGSFCGAEDGLRLLKSLISKSDFNTEAGAIAFAALLLAHLQADRRTSPNAKVSIADQLKKGVSEEDVLDVIFGFSYLKPRYLLRWSGKNIEELSPGEKRHASSDFHLLIDRRDIPLIIDQPEENLDNHTVYDLLVPAIKIARKSRQVVIVTHNPNLAVVCDADQIVYCSMDKPNGNKVTYLAGALENPEINRATINVLEGTRPAFDHRDNKYEEPSPSL